MRTISDTVWIEKGFFINEAARNICSIYENKALSFQTCQQWFGQFWSGNFSLKDFPWLGELSSVNIEQTTASELAKLLNKSATSIINTFMNTKKEMSELGQSVPHHLTASQLNQKVALCLPLKSRLTTTPCLGRIISNKKWVVYIPIQWKWQWLVTTVK